MSNRRRSLMITSGVCYCKRQTCSERRVKSEVFIFLAHEGLDCFIHVENSSKHISTQDRCQHNHLFWVSALLSFLSYMYWTAALLTVSQSQSSVSHPIWHTGHSGRLPALRSLVFLSVHTRLFKYFQRELNQSHIYPRCKISAFINNDLYIQQFSVSLNLLQANNFIYFKIHIFLGICFIIKEFYRSITDSGFYR